MNASPWIILVAMLLYGVVHSILAALSFKARLRQWLGAHTDRWYRLFYNVFATLSLLPVLALPALLPDRTLYRIPAPWSYLAMAGQVAAALMLIVALLQTDVLAFIGLRQLLEGPKPGGKGKLVVKGFYRWVRHPLYTAGLIFIWLTPTMTANLLALYAGVTIYIVIGALFEERKLLHEFGEEYKSYRQRTPMLIPLRLIRR